MCIFRSGTICTLTLALFACAASPDFGSEPSAQQALPHHDTFDGQWRMRISSEPQVRLFQSARLRCSAIERVEYLYIAGGRVLNFLSRKQPAIIGVDGEFDFDVPAARPIYRTIRQGDGSPREDREWFRYRGALAENSGDGSYTQASTKYGGTGCGANVALRRLPTTTLRARKINVPVASDRETLLLDYSAVDRDCQPAVLKLEVLSEPRGGTLRMAPSSDADTRDNRLRIKFGDRSCLKQPVDQRRQVFYQPNPGFTGKDTFSMVSMIGDGLEVRTQSFDIVVGDSR